MRCATSDAALAARLAAAREAPDALPRKAESELLLALAPHLEDFVATLFRIDDEVRALEQRHHELAPLYVVKRQFVQRKAMNAHGPTAAAFDAEALRDQLEREIGAAIDDTAGELAFARAVLVWQGDAAQHAAATRRRGTLRRVGGAHAGRPGAASARRAVPGAAQARLHATRSGRDRRRRTAIEALALDGAHPRRRRDGFALTDAGTDLVGALDEAHYCIWCHEQGKDSCSRGLLEKKPADGSVAGESVQAHGRSA